MTSTKSKFYQYVDGVIDGKIPSNKWIRLAVERFIRDCDKKDYIFDYKAGERVVDLSEKVCHHWKGIYAKKPIVLLPHQHFYLIQLYGWKTRNNTRRFRRSYKEIARKEAKTTECAIKGIFGMAKSGEQGAQIFAAATKEDQASIVVNDTARIILGSPQIKNLFKVFKHKELYKRVIYEPTQSFMKPLGRDSDTQDGLDPYMAIIDEYHAHPDNSIIDVLQTGMGMREEPLTDIITTAGLDLSVPCFEFRKMCMDVLDGTLQDDALLALIFNLDNEETWKEDEEQWILANPNMADPVLKERVLLPYLRQQVKEAINEGGQKEIEVKTKNFNIWCDAPDVWLAREIWLTNKHGFRPEDLKGKVCYGGLDLARTVDLNAFALWFPNFDGDRHAVLVWFWIPKAKVLQNKDRVDYKKWVNEGLITETDGNVADYKRISYDIKNIIKEYDFKSLSYDKYLTGHGVLADLLDEGIQCHELPQNIVTLNMPTKELERIATAGKLEHFGNPVLAWMIGNTLLAKDTSGNVKPDKGKSEKKIDGVSAMINALAEYKTFEGPTFTIGIL